jgi:hypothetical protein
VVKHVSADLAPAWRYEADAITARRAGAETEAARLDDLAELARRHPARLWRRRTPGYRLADECTNHRGYRCVTRPGRYSNPYRVVPQAGRWLVEVARGLGLAVGDTWSNREVAQAVAVDLYAQDLYAGRLPYTVDDVRRDLGGLDLACFCPPGMPCHAYVLLEVASDGYTCGCERCVPPCEPWDPTPDELAAADAEVARQHRPGGKFYTGPITDYEWACAEAALGHPIPRP